MKNTSFSICHCGLRLYSLTVLGPTTEFPLALLHLQAWSTHESTDNRNCNISSFLSIRQLHLAWVARLLTSLYRLLSLRKFLRIKGHERVGVWGSMRLSLMEVRNHGEHWTAKNYTQKLKTQEKSQKNDSSPKILCEEFVPCIHRIKENRLSHV